ncbi:putative disease resistance RPP13-like protein 1 [Tripterygium wilfordii]|uniref:putative disease resistance RPP13-like protein 1 n=1 Tax=Tripterygium wilfordii TaxID=458696 RepID=UPI0018F806E8|nr:putative disease resistance RPP13-like protein 1 [Tripterygium wilfordii]
MEVVAEALVSASVESLFKMLGSSDLLNFAPKKKIHADLKNWETTLRRINGLLQDAEEKQLTDKGVKIWLVDLQNLAYDIEDVLDEFATETLKRKVMKDSHASTEKLHKLIPSCSDKLQKLIPSCSCSFAFKSKMASKIDDITERLQNIAQQEQSLNLMTIAIGMRSKEQKERPSTTSLVDESHIYGRNDEKEAIVQMLLRDEGGNNSISVFPILGMGGIGKTTQAQLVYNDSTVKDNFNIKDLDLNSLQEKLKEKLFQKKFLLILDDVWEEDYNQWDLLRGPFVTVAPGSKIVVTTRKNNVAPIMGDVSTFHVVKELPDDECLLLLACHALGANSFDARPDLKDIGKELVKRCNGLPLAAKVLGGLLRNKRSHGEWDRVLRNNLWNSPKTRNSVHPTLKLSYNDLPPHLKRCFIYCAIFPKDYEFDRDELVLLWMAEGFLQNPLGGTLMEDLGIEYFEDLVSRSFFQSSTGNFRPFFQSKLFVMHDLTSDLAQTIAEDICYNYENKTKVARVLSLADSPTGKLSNSIGDLIHLRFINLSDTFIEQLPESVSSLFNLQTLLLFSCHKLKKLPDKIRNLVNLRHLDISSTPELKKLPSGIGMLTNLQTLSKFIVQEGDGATIAELQNLNNLRGSLSIEGLQNVQDAKLASLKGKQGLEELALKWDYYGGNDESVLEPLELYGRDDYGRSRMSVLESLEPHQNLKRLTISSYDGAEFPSWMTNIRLVSLELLKCEQIKLLPPLGQLCLLKELRIHGLGAVKTIGGEFYGNGVESFPSLERLEIDEMSEWIEWSHGNMGGDQGFPNLQELIVCNCPKLIGSLPSGLHRLRHVSKLEIIGCGSLVSFAPMGLPCSLKSIRVRNCDALQCFPIIYTDDSEQSLLEELYIGYCSSLKYLEGNFKLPTSLRKLTIERCGNLLSLPDGLMLEDDNANQSQSQSHLDYLAIEEFCNWNHHFQRITRHLNQL